MTPPCPRCGAPLHGPVCASCGTRFDVAPPGQYPAPPGPPPPAYPFNPPPPVAYAPPGYVPPRPARVTGAAVTNIVLFSIYLLFALLGIAGASEQQPADERQGAVIVGVVLLLMGAAGLAMGVYLLKGRWWGGLVAGILHAVLGLIYLITLLAVLVAKEKFDAQGDAVGTVIGVFVVLNLITWTAMILSFVAMARLKDHGSRVHPATAAQHF